MRITFAAHSAAGPNVSSTERLVNLYAVPVPEGGRARYYLRAVRGTRDFASVPGPFLRQLASANGVLYAASAGKLSRVAASGSVATVGTIPDDAATTLTGVPGGRLGVCAGGAYFLVDGSDITQPAGGRLTGITSICFANQYVLMASGREIEWTAVGEPDVRNALYFSTAESGDDDIVRLMAVGSYVWVLKQRSLEIWGIAGTGTGAWARLPGAVRDRGLKGFNLVCAIPDALFFIGNDSKAYIGAGTDVADVSSPVIDQAIIAGGATHVTYHEDRGHRFCTIRFDNRPSWVLDLKTRLWHERALGVDHDPWGGTHIALAHGRWNVGNALGAVQRFGGTPVDAEGPMRRMAVSRTLRTGERFTVSKLEIEGKFDADIEEDAPAFLLDELGRPILDQDGRPLRAQEPGEIETWKRGTRLWLRASKDGGAHYGLPKVRTMGRDGQTMVCRFRAMGQFRQFTAELNITDPVDVPILSEAEIE